MMIFHFRAGREMHENKDEEAKKIVENAKQKKKEILCIAPPVSER